jgi:hypothetical protein
MKRAKLSEEYGVDGEFYFEDDGDFGQSRNPKFGIIVNYNEPPSTQPSLWCHWIILDDMQTIQWDGGEKFYNYVEWLEYLISKILEPAGYIVNGVIQWVGEDIFDDRGSISVEDNKISVEYFIDKIGYTKVDF